MQTEQTIANTINLTRIPEKPSSKEKLESVGISEKNVDQIFFYYGDSLEVMKPNEYRDMPDTKDSLLKLVETLNLQNNSSPEVFKQNILKITGSLVNIYNEQYIRADITNEPPVEPVLVFTNSVIAPEASVYTPLNLNSPDPENPEPEAVVMNIDMEILKRCMVDGKLNLDYYASVIFHEMTHAQKRHFKRLGEALNSDVEPIAETGAFLALNASYFWDKAIVNIRKEVSGPGLSITHWTGEALTATSKIAEKTLHLKSQEGVEKSILDIHTVEDKLTDTEPVFQKLRNAYKEFKIQNKYSDNKNKDLITAKNKLRQCILESIPLLNYRECRQITIADMIYDCAGHDWTFNRDKSSEEFIKKVDNQIAIMAEKTLKMKTDYNESVHNTENLREYHLMLYRSALRLEFLKHEDLPPLPITDRVVDFFDQTISEPNKLENIETFKNFYGKMEADFAENIDVDIDLDKFNSSIDYSKLELGKFYVTGSFKHWSYNGIPRKKYKFPELDDFTQLYYINFEKNRNEWKKLAIELLYSERIKSERHWDEKIIPKIATDGIKFELFKRNIKNILIAQDKKFGWNLNIDLIMQEIEILSRLPEPIKEVEVENKPIDIIERINNLTHPQNLHSIIYTICFRKKQEYLHDLPAVIKAIYETNQKFTHKKFDFGTNIEDVFTSSPFHFLIFNLGKSYPKLWDTIQNDPKYKKQLDDEFAKISDYVSSLDLDDLYKDYIFVIGNAGKAVEISDPVITLYCEYFERMAEKIEVKSLKDYKVVKLLVDRIDTLAGHFTNSMELRFYREIRETIVRSGLPIFEKAQGIKNIDSRTDSLTFYKLRVLNQASTLEEFTEVRTRLGLDIDKLDNSVKLEMLGLNIGISLESFYDILDTVENPEKLLEKIYVRLSSLDNRQKPNTTTIHTVLRELRLLDNASVAQFIRTKMFSMNDGNLNKDMRNRINQIFEKILPIEEVWLRDMIRIAVNTGSKDMLAEIVPEILAPYIFAENKNLKPFSKRKYLDTDGDWNVDLKKLNSKDREEFYEKIHRENPEDIDHPLFRFQDKVMEKLEEAQVDKSEKKSNEKNPNRGIIQLIEAAQRMGGVVVSVLQIIFQLLKIDDPEVAKALSKVQDKNPGTPWAIFWINVEKCVNSTEGEKLAFLKNIKLTRTLGAGSLFTTFLAINQKEPNTQEFVVQMPTPQLSKFSTQHAEFITEVLKELGKKYPASKFPTIGVMSNIVKLGLERVKRDVGDTKAVSNHHQFKQQNPILRLVENISQFYLPRTEDTDKPVVVLITQDMIYGDSLQTALETAQNPEAKKEILQKDILDFQNMLFEQTPDQNGNYLILSDPHSSNKIVDKNGADINIDTRMMLTFSEQEMEVFRSIYKVFIEKSSSQEEFVETLDSLLNLIAQRQEDKTQGQTSLKNNQNTVNKLRDWMIFKVFKMKNIKVDNLGESTKQFLVASAKNDGRKLAESFINKDTKSANLDFQDYLQIFYKALNRIGLELDMDTFYMLRNIGIKAKEQAEIDSLSR